MGKYQCVWEKRSGRVYNAERNFRKGCRDLFEGFFFAYFLAGY